jgi:hypothetical protein
VFERDHRVGGRVADIHIGPHARLEQGGSILHASNKYMRSFAQDVLNLTLQEPPQKIDGRLGVWDGNGFALRLGGQHWLWDAATVFYRYGFDFMRLEQIVRGVAQKFTSIYALQEQRRAVYESPRAMLEAMGLWEHTQLSFHRFLHTHREWVSGCSRDGTGGGGGDPELLLRELAVASTRVNYNQDLEINALAGAVGLIPMTDRRLWAVEQGNARIIEGLFQRAGADVRIGHTVKLVERVDMRGDDPESGHLRVHGRRVNRKDAAAAAAAAAATAASDGGASNTAASSPPPPSEVFSEDFEVVIVATALELTPELQFRIPKRGRASYTNSGSGEPVTAEVPPSDATVDESLYLPQPLSAAEYPRTFQTTHATFVAARLRPGAFGLKTDAELPGTILTTENEEQHQASIPFTSIAAYATIQEEDIVVAHAGEGQQQPQSTSSNTTHANTEGESNNNSTNKDTTAVSDATEPPSSSGSERGPRKVYKVFSRTPFTRARIESYFDDVLHPLTSRTAWRAYPRSSVPEEFLPSFSLYAQVLYPPALEPAASCMELAAVAARNVAGLVARAWREKLEMQEQFEQHERDEL